STKTNPKAASRVQRHRRVRRKVRGTAERPRLAVYRSNVGIYAQVIDDQAGKTLTAASSLDDSLDVDGDGKVAVAAAVGKLVSERAKALGITSVTFDRGGNRYHGRVAALADSAREEGLQF